MQKFIYGALPLLFFLFSAAPAEAQFKDLRISVHGGLTGYHLVSHVDGLRNTSSIRYGYAVGAAINIPYNFALSVQPEIMLSRKGGQDRNPDPDAEVKRGEVSLTYFEVPVLLRLNIFIPGNVRPFIYVGPSFGFLLDAKGFTDGVEEDASDFYRDRAASLIIGTGAEYEFLNIQFRYGFGITDIFDGIPANSNVVSFRQYTSGFSLMLGIYF